jgi:hypothetical protein
MARVPCFLCDQRFDGEARNVYVTFYDGDLFAKFRHIVCPDCEQSIAEPCLGRALHRDSHGRWVDPDSGETLQSIQKASGADSDAIRWKKVS